MDCTDTEVVDQLAAVWASIAALCGGLTEAEWKVPTECPGWSVQDNLAHIIGIESVLLGRPVPEHLPPDGPHLKNDVGRMNEVWVDSRRALPGHDVLAEYVEVTEARLATLRAPSFDFTTESWTPVGPATIRDLIPFRVFDSWIHEQDMRRALGKPGDLDGPVAREAIGRVARSMPMVVGKKVAPPDGATVVFAVRGPAGRELAIGMHGGRAQVLDATPAEPTVRLTMSDETFVRLGAGRGDPDEILASGAVAIEGNGALGDRIAREMNVLF